MNRTREKNDSSIYLELFKEIGQYVQSIESQKNESLSTQSAIADLKDIFVKHLMHE